MGRKNSSAYNQELDKLITKYEAGKNEDRQPYMDADQLADIADRYASERRFIEAQEVIDFGLRLHSGNTELQIEQAYLYLDTQNVHLAKETVESITEDYNTEVKMLKAEIYLYEGQFEAANTILSTIEDADELGGIIDIVYLFLDMGYPEAALEWLEKGKEGYSHEEDYIAVTADYLSATNQLEAAANEYNRLIDIDPFNAAYWVGLAKCRFAEEDTEKAIEACDFALAADDKCGDAYMYRAHSYFYLNNMDGAIADYKKAMECKTIAPEMGYMFVGMAHSSKEEWKEANDSYQIVIREFEAKGDGNSPLLTDTYTNAAIAAFNLGNREEAYQLCDKAKIINPEESVIFLTEGKLYLKEERDKEAYQCFKKALEIENTAEMWYLVGSAYSDAEMLYQAKLCFEKAYELDPEYSDVVEKLSILCLMHYEVDNFFKYNSQCHNPVTEDTILDLLSHHEDSEEGKKLLQEVWERMKKDKENNNSN